MSSLNSECPAGTGEVFAALSTCAKSLRPVRKIQARRVLGGGDFVMEVLREADQRVKRYLPAREKEAFIERIVEEICGKYVCNRVRSIFFALYFSAS